MKSGNKKKRDNRLKGQANKKLNLLSGESNLKSNLPDDHICFSFKHLDVTQGHTLEIWENNNLMAKTLKRFQEYSKKNIAQAKQDIRVFKIYGGVPSKSEFAHPRHVPEDASWSSLHVQGLECVIGHVVHNVFYVVFLDGEHKFYPVPKPNT